MKRILVADDSVTIQKVIALTFADEPFEIQSVGTGSEALELVKSWNPDIVLADVIMPQMNGYELCRAIKQQEETSSVPVLLLAGTFEAFDEDEANSVGANGFITKPFESGELIEKVKNLVGGLPEAPQADQPPAEPAVQAVPDAGAAGEVAPQPDTIAETARPVAGTSEPDIWDILSDSGENLEARAPEGGTPTPGFRPIESEGVIDVGSFDVGIGRPESAQPVTPPSTKPPADAAPDHGVKGEVPDFQGQQIPETPPVVQPPPVAVPPEMKSDAPQGQTPQTPEAPPLIEPLLDTEERSRIENIEKDFFGFETGAVEEVEVEDILEDAVEEVTFEIEQPQEVPSVAGERGVPPATRVPEGDQVVTGDEAVALDYKAPESPSAPEIVPDRADEVVDISAPGGVESDQATAPGGIPELRPEPVSEAETPAPTETPADISRQPEPEPPLELPVDLTPDLPEEFSPEPAAEPVKDVSADAVPEVPSEPLSGVKVDTPDDETIRKIVEERVEKIAWEVVPEMAEVIIREAIQKIKNGS